jgi:Flp pilus assembly protein TadD
MRRSVLLAMAVVILGGVLFSIRIVKATQYPELLLSQGIEEMGREEYEKALERFKKAAEAKPHDPEVHYFLGLAYSRLEDYPIAITAFEKVLELDPQNRRVRYELGMAHFFSGDYQRAADSLQRARKDDPSNPMVLLYLGVAYMSLRRDKEATEALRACIEMNPSPEVVAMARDYLDKIPVREKPKKRLRLFATLSFQYDDNVILKPEGLTTAEFIADESDYRGVGFFWGEYQFLHGTPWLGGLRYSFYQSIHTQLHDFDLTNNAAALYGGYRGKLKRFPSKLQGEYEYQYTLLDNKSYLERHSGILNLDVIESPSLLTQLTYRGQEKNFHNQPLQGPADDRDAFNHRAGLTQYLFFSEQTRHIHGGYFYDQDDADGSNWDYEGHLVSAGFFTPLIYGVRLRLKSEYYWQDFDNTHTTFLKKREDREWTQHVSLDRDFGKYLNISAYYVYQDHQSNLDVFEYERNIVFLSITGRY